MEDLSISEYEVIWGSALDDETDSILGKGSFFNKLA
jgi:hypothetical protein